MANFQKKVYFIVRQIPKGKATTYREIAKALNCKAYRAVGNALNKNKSKNVPCHRVVKSNGEVGGFARGTKQKIKLLRKEGIEIKKGRIKKHNFFTHLNVTPTASADNSSNSTL